MSSVQGFLCNLWVWGTAQWNASTQCTHPSGFIRSLMRLEKHSFASAEQWLLPCIAHDCLHLENWRMVVYPCPHSGQHWGLLRRRSDPQSLIPASHPLPYCSLGKVSSGPAWFGVASLLPVLILLSCGGRPGRFRQGLSPCRSKCLMQDEECWCHEKNTPMLR